MARSRLSTVVQLLMTQLVIQLASGLDQSELHYSIQEESPRDTFVCNLTKDINLESTYSSDKLSEIRFDFLNSGSSNDDLFVLDPVTGILVTSQDIDRDAMCENERVCDINLDIQLMPSQYFKIIKVQVTLVDINDNAPVFRDPHVVKTILESSQPDTKLSLPVAYDPDGPEFGIKSYELVDESGTFALAEGFNTADDIQLVLLTPLDRETQSLYVIQINAIDGGTPAKSGVLQVEIQVLDVNDNSPSFDNDTYNVVVSEDIPLMSTILTVHASDPDDGINGQVEYGLSSRTETADGSTFMIDPISGEIVIIGQLDYEQQTLYTLYVTGRDKTPNAVATRAKVIVHVEDLNDHAPQITIKTPLTDGKIMIIENSPNNSFIAHIGVSDQDDGQNGDYSCFLDSEYFSLQELYVTDYKITAAIVFDRETRDVYTVVMTCVDKGEEPKRSSVELSVMVTDENDQAPTFTPSVIHVNIEEANSPGARVTQVTAYDSDMGDNAQITYSLVDDAGGIFSIQEDTGVISCKVMLNHEKTRSLNVTVKAKDDGTPVRSGIALVVIHVTDVDDERPVFTQDLYKFSVLENQAPGTVVGQVRADDADGPLHNVFSYLVEESSDEFGKLFAIDPETGVIRTLAGVDREITPVYHVIIAARSDTGHGYVTYTSIKIQVLDLNDNPPMIIYPSKANHTIYVDPLTALPGQQLVQIQALDMDTDVNSVCEYRAISDIADGIISVNPYNGSLFLKGDLQSLQTTSVYIQLTVYDCGTPRLNDTRTLVINFVNEGRGTLSLNTIIVTVISVVTVIIAGILIFFIVYMILKRRKLDTKYNWVVKHRIQTDEGATEGDSETGSQEAICPPSARLGEQNDAITSSQKLGEGLNSLPEKRTVDGQESNIHMIEKEPIVSTCICIIL